MRIKLLIPLLLILAGLWGLAGCIWLPIPEHQVSKGKDFRELLGPDPAHPKFHGVITRAMVIAALGPPPFQSVDGNTIGYWVQRDSGLRIEPLCFSITDDMADGYGANLFFNTVGQLQKWAIVKQSIRNTYLTPNFDSRDMVLQQLNATKSSKEAPLIESHPLNK